MSELAEGLTYIAKWKDSAALSVLRLREDPEDLQAAARELTKEHYDTIRDLIIQLNNENLK
jgi:hypothetical protein